ncbi:putative malate dehydrogenase 1B [Achroia grisella]|uniref:putative malate dehydrogenase 1B n=1 Tax=Achroia grisella TaxID=688607 RepID=UPI0027D303EA|nr:putative malate dehydrogenase 1B [Achroia grisella]
MVVRIIIAGESQCIIFAEVCLVADHLKKNLPNFCYERIEKPILEWNMWLCKINQKNKWHHKGSPLIWKELFSKGSKPHYIGGSSEFLDYCHSYYKFDVLLASEKIETLIKSYKSYQTKLKSDRKSVKRILETTEEIREQPKTNFVVCISGARYPLTMHLISGLLDMSQGEKTIYKIYIYDEECTKGFMEFIEQECSYISTNHPGKVVKYIEKVGVALTHSDLFIILDHVPFQVESSIGDWIQANKKLMENMALKINASASQKMCILLPNLGPACYNATVLMNSVTYINKNNIVVATSDLGLEISSILAEIAEVSMRTIFCPPVWGFVGINHLVDIRTTVHKYDSFTPYDRYIKVKKSSLTIGSLTPEMRTMQYLVHFDKSLWIKHVEKKAKMTEDKISINKAISVLELIKLWLFNSNDSCIINLGIRCNGSFGLTFSGAFSQPAHFVNGEWTPASNYILPKDPQMNIKYLQQMAEIVMKMNKNELPKLIPYFPCTCKKKYYKKKGVW